MSAAAFIVTVHDTHGYVISAHAVCRKHAEGDNHAQHALATGSYVQRDARGKPVVTVKGTSDRAIRCDECHPVDS